jgi:hypothetical protein
LDEYQRWLWGQWGEKCVAQLKKHEFDAHFVSSGEEARADILKVVSAYDTFGFGGSATTRRIGLVSALLKMGKTVYDHWKKGLSKEEDLDARLQMGRCDCFFTSANAVSLSGELVNVDGIGNRTNAATFGPKKIMVVAGMNKVTADLDSALRRLRDVAGPMRAKSLNLKTPCAETGLCTDCNSPQRICRVTTILHRAPMMSDISVFLVNEALGF